MRKNSDSIRRNTAPALAVDAVDRKLLGLLSEDATKTYAELGRPLNVSAPAIHERVKRLRRGGFIRATVAKLDGAKLGRPLLAFVQSTQLVGR